MYAGYKIGKYTEKMKSANDENKKNIYLNKLNYYKKILGMHGGGSAIDIAYAELSSNIRGFKSIDIDITTGKFIITFNSNENAKIVGDRLSSDYGNIKVIRDANRVVLYPDVFQNILRNYGFEYFDNNKQQPMSEQLFSELKQKKQQTETSLLPSFLETGQEQELEQEYQPQTASVTGMPSQQNPQTASLTAMSFQQEPTFAPTSMTAPQQNSNTQDLFK